MDKFGSLELTITDNDKKILGNLLSKYVSGLAKNITSRFNECLSVLSSFSILSPVAHLNSWSMATKRSRSWVIIFFFFKRWQRRQRQRDDKEDKEVTKAQLEAEWAKFKFDLDAWKKSRPSINSARKQWKEFYPYPIGVGFAASS